MVLIKRVIISEEEITVLYGNTEEVGGTVMGVAQGLGFVPAGTCYQTDLKIAGAGHFLKKVLKKFTGSTDQG